MITLDDFSKHQKACDKFFEERTSVREISGNPDAGLSFEPRTEVDYEVNRTSNGKILVGYARRTVVYEKDGKTPVCENVEFAYSRNELGMMERAEA